MPRGFGFLLSVALAALLAFILAQPTLQGWLNESQPQAPLSAPTASAAPPRPEGLTRFLRARDVDEALAAARALSFRDEAVQASIRHLVTSDADWTREAQGVYNLLQHSYMLPADLRFSTLQRGLIESDETQLRLAAAVGVQFTAKKMLDAAPVAERALRELLLQYAAESAEDDFLAARAFLAVKNQLQHPRDTRFVLALLGDKIVWRNALTWMLTHVSTREQPLTTQRLVELIEQERAAESSTPSDAAPGALPWTPAWSQRLRAVDVDALRGTAGAALDDYWAKQSATGAKGQSKGKGKGKAAKIAEYQEIDIPSYAPLQQGFVHEDGSTTLGNLADAPAVTAALAKQRGAGKPEPHVPHGQTPLPRFEPDVVLSGVHGEEQARSNP